MNATLEPVLEHERTRHFGPSAKRHTDAYATSSEPGASLMREKNGGFSSGRGFVPFSLDFSGRGIPLSPLNDV
jgi:hypothetical protein